MLFYFAPPGTRYHGEQLASKWQPVDVRENSGTVVVGCWRDLLAIHQAGYIRRYAVVK